MLAQSIDLQSGGRALKLFVPLLKDDALKGWIHLATVGEWKGHQQGPFTLELSDFDAMVRNFEHQKNPIVLDWEHQTETGEKAPASGWIQQLEIRNADSPEDAELWAFVELVDEAETQIRRGQYEFTSPVIIFGAKDRKTNAPIGCYLKSCAITNTPFFDGQTPMGKSLVLKHGWKGDAMATLAFKDELAQMRKLLGLPKHAGIDKIQAAVKAFAELELARGDEGTPEVSSEAATQAEPAEAPTARANNLPPEPTSRALQEEGPPSEGGDGGSLESVLAMLAQVTGMSPEELLAALQANAEAVAAALMGGAPQAAASAAMSTKLGKAADARIATLTLQLKQRDQKIEALSTQMQRIEQSQLEHEISGLVEKGEILPHQKEFAVWLKQSDAKRFDEWYGNRNPGDTAPVRLTAAPRNDPAVSKTSGPDLASIDWSDPSVVRVMNIYRGDMMLAKNETALKNKVAAFLAKHTA